MFINVFVDIETFHELVLNDLEFMACLVNEGEANIGLTVPKESIYTTEEPDMVLVKQ